MISEDRVIKSIEAVVVIKCRFICPGDDVSV